MAFQLTSQELYSTQLGKFTFEGPVRSHAIGLAVWHIDATADRYATLDPERVKVRIKLKKEGVPRNEIHYEVEATVDDIPCEGPEGRVWARCRVSCIADIGGPLDDDAADPCAMLVGDFDGQGPSSRPWRFAERILTGFERVYGGDRWSEPDGAPDYWGFIAMGTAEGRTFCKELPYSPEVDEIDFQDLIGPGVNIKDAVAFVQEAIVGYGYNRDVPWVFLSGGVKVERCEGSRVGFTSFDAGSKLLIVVRTEPVLIPPERDRVKLRLSEVEASPHNQYLWEWEVSEGHWHRTSRVSDDLDWRPDASHPTLSVTVLNHTTRPICLTLNGAAWGPVLSPGEMSLAMRFGVDNVDQKIWGNFGDGACEALPDPTFTPIKQGGG